jgi:hypothetical protein
MTDWADEPPPLTRDGKDYRTGASAHPLTDTEIAGCIRAMGRKAVEVAVSKKRMALYDRRNSIEYLFGEVGDDDEIPAELPVITQVTLDFEDLKKDWKSAPLTT